MVDVHCHLNFKSFSQDYDEVIKQARKDGVEKIINVGTQISSSKLAVELAQKYENLYAIVGIHPHHADSPFTLNKVKGMPEENYLAELEELAKKPKVVAIGEIGLDYYPYASNGVVDPTLQKKLFIEQIELAHKLNLPLQIHNRQAGEDILDILINHKSLIFNNRPPGMFHCFAGTVEVLKQVLDLGFYVGFDGNITYEGIAKGETVPLPELVKYAPLDRIVTETDSPFLTPEPNRRSRNIPSYVILVGQEIAKIKAVPFEKVEEQTVKNAYDIFLSNNLHSLSS